MMKAFVCSNIFILWVIPSQPRPAHHRLHVSVPWNVFFKDICNSFALKCPKKKHSSSYNLCLSRREDEKTGRRYLVCETFPPQRRLSNNKKQLSWSRLSLITCQNQISFIHSAQNHHHVASVGFRICTMNDPRFKWGKSCQVLAVVLHAPSVLTGKTPIDRNAILHVVDQGQPARCSWCPTVSIWAARGSP